MSIGVIIIFAERVRLERMKDAHRDDGASGEVAMTIFYRRPPIGMFKPLKAADNAISEMIFLFARLLTARNTA